MGRLAALVVLGAAVAGFWLWLRSSPGRSRGGEARLLRVCRGNVDQVERLIQGEIARSPEISRAEAASRAVQRYRRDNR